MFGRVSIAMAGSAPGGQDFDLFPAEEAAWQAVQSVHCALLQWAAWTRRVPFRSVSSFGALLSHRGTPSHHPFSIGIFHCKPSSYWGIPDPHVWETTILGLNIFGILWHGDRDAAFENMFLSNGWI